MCDDINSSKNCSEVSNHHKQQEFCYTRPAYRATRRLTAVKVYTVASESQHLLIYNVPSINLRNELKQLCLKYGQVTMINVVSDCETELFTECYHVQFSRIQSARIAKRLIDNKSFYGQVLHVCYAPEYESISETRLKLSLRKKEICLRKVDNLEFDVKTIGDNENILSISKSQLQKRRRLEEVDSSSENFVLPTSD